MSSKELTREELIDIILANNMLEQFVEWLRLRGVDNDIISLRDIDHRYLYEFAIEKKLLIEGDDAGQDYKDADQDFEDLLKKKIALSLKPRKIRRKT
ncbi:MAG: hypothetical protein QW464_04140 [Ignisphaera sp.]